MQQKFLVLVGNVFPYKMYLKNYIEGKTLFWGKDNNKDMTRVLHLLYSIQTLNDHIFVYTDFNVSVFTSLV